MAEQQSLFKESQPQPETPGTSEDVTETAPAPATKRRGRKSLKETAATAEKEADETADTMTADEPEAEQTATGAEEQPEDGKEEENEMNMENIIPEEAYAAAGNGTDDETDSELIAQLQAKINAHNEDTSEKREAMANGVWEGDPADGTDFIPVVDLPIEDQMALPNYDMFDNPTVPVDMNTVVYTPRMEQEAMTAFDFEDIITANGVLEIMPDGSILLNGTPCDAPGSIEFKELATTLARLKASADKGNISTIVTISADSDSPHQASMSVLDACAKAGIKQVSFAEAN